MVWLGFVPCGDAFEGFDISTKETWDFFGLRLEDFASDSLYAREVKALVKNKQVIPFILASNEGDEHA